MLTMYLRYGRTGASSAPARPRELRDETEAEDGNPVLRQHLTAVGTPISITASSACSSAASGVVTVVQPVGQGIVL